MEYNNYILAFEDAKNVGYPTLFIKEDKLVCNICGKLWGHWETLHAISMSQRAKKLFYGGKGCPDCRKGKG